MQNQIVLLYLYRTVQTPQRNSYTSPVYNAAGSIYLPEKEVQPQNKGNTYCSIFSTKIQNFYKKSVRSVL